MQRDDVRLFEQLIERDAPGGEPVEAGALAERARLALPRKHDRIVMRVVAKSYLVAPAIERLHPESGRSARHRPTDPPVTYYAERLAGNPTAQKRIEIPAGEFARARKCVGFDNPPRHGKNQGPGQIGRRLSQR